MNKIKAANIHAHNRKAVERSISYALCAEAT
jgi:hypothetical protein